MFTTYVDNHDVASYENNGEITDSSSQEDGCSDDEYDCDNTINTKTNTSNENKWNNCLFRWDGDFRSGQLNVSLKSTSVSMPALRDYTNSYFSE